MANEPKEPPPEQRRPNIDPYREPNWIKEGYDPDKGVLPPLKNPNNSSDDKKK